LKLGEHGVFKTVQPGPGIVASGQGREKVIADLPAHGFLDVSGVAKFCQCSDLSGSSHYHYASPDSTTCRVVDEIVRFGKPGSLAANDQPPTTLILLVRHGQTPTTGQVLPGRAPGLYLSDHGRSQAAQVAERLQVLAVTAVYASPMERTVQTAQPTA